MALELWDDIVGRLIMNGVDYMTIETEPLVSLLYSCVIDDIVSTGASRFEVREEVNKKIAEVAMIYNANLAQNLKQLAAAGAPSTQPIPEPEPFRLTPQMQQALGIQVNKKPGGK
jgi:hypothetical protein